MRFILFPLLAFTVAAQTPTFEVASIRPSNSPSTLNPLCDPKLSLSPESVLASGVLRLAALIEHSYRPVVDGFEIPQQVRDAGLFAVSVRIPPNTSHDTCNQMLRNLLTERFHLVTALETRDVNRYYLKVAKSGVKLRTVGGPPADLQASFTSSTEDLRVRYTFRGAPASRVISAITSAAVLDARRRGIQFSSFIDETGLTGYYDGDFEITLPSQSDLSALPDSFENAIVRQLGLTLELRKVPGKIAVVLSSDRVPTDN